MGPNYADHAKELKNPIPSEPLIFTKSPANDSLVAFLNGEAIAEAEICRL